MNRSSHDSHYLFLAVVTMLVAGTAFATLSGSVSFMVPVTEAETAETGWSQTPSPSGAFVARSRVRPRGGWGSATRRRPLICALRVSGARAAFSLVTCSGVRKLRGGFPASEPVVADQEDESVWRRLAPTVGAKRGGMVIGPRSSASPEFDARKRGGIDKEALQRNQCRAVTVAFAAAGAAVDSLTRFGGDQSLRQGLETLGEERMKPQVMPSKPVHSKPSGWSNGRYRVVPAGQNDLDEASALCIKVFFGDADRPWKLVQLRQLKEKQRQDLESRCNEKESVMFKALDSRRDGEMVGFIEVWESSAWKYGMGGGVPQADARPVVSNLAVDPRARRCGIGSALMDACEDTVKKWCFNEIILQVEQDNNDALNFYGGLGFRALFVDRGARRYDTSGFLLRNVRTTKVTMRKALDAEAETQKNGQEKDVAEEVEMLALLLGIFVKPFVAALPRPTTRSRSRSASPSVENPKSGSGSRTVPRPLGSDERGS